jgi:endonuclease/exonuclease/phosphatase family metal-dependent hydrolase
VRRRFLGACAIALLTLADGFAQPVPPAPPRELRVLTFNIHHAEGADLKIDVARIAALIKESRADLVGLQEVDRGVERSGRRDLLKEIADLAGMRFVFGKNIDHQGGDYGNALLTSRPIVSEGNRLLPNTDGGEQRGVLQVVVDVDGTQVLVLDTHLDARRPDAQRIASADAMLGMIESWGAGPVIAMGDFNDVPGSPTWTRLTTILTDVWTAVGSGDGFTIPVEAPRKRIDWILVRGLEPVSVDVLRTDASDHLPVVATLRTR